MKKCCECKKTVWPWQQSRISFSPIHKRCHETLLANSLAKNPELRGMYVAEIADFENKTNANTGLRI